ncbi:ABC transporter ATP-binding protein [Lacisediminimonas profundi]|uniref:ABC transporter ATP-binding protein n=1 Tax=Lacisediminimonas profundi TaxID=2603856 RepID=UPI00138707E9|nr:ABC transporter ATP-binding protein [Lacisediminimonas profundi]
MSALIATGITRRYSGFNALEDVNFSLAAGERRALIGPNGAGKSTLFDILGGQREPSSGTITFDGQDITRQPAHQRALNGLARTFQRNNLCQALSVLENIRLAVQAHGKAKHDLMRHAKAHTAIVERAEQVLENMSMSSLAMRRAGELSYGDQRKLEIAMAIASEPRVLMVDEPTAGMSPAETAEMVAVMQNLPRSMSLLIVEHDMDVVAALADRTTVLQNGIVIAEGSWDDVRNSEVVQRAYIGGQRTP